MNRSWFFLVLIVPAILFQCKPKFDNEFTTNFKKYIATFEKGTMNDGIYLIIPVYACNSCVDGLVESLKSNLKFDHIVIIGIAETSAELYYLKQQLNGYTFLKDTQGLTINTLKIDCFYPYIVQIENEKVLFRASIKANENLDEIVRLIEEY